MISVVKGNLFDHTDEGAILLHACNAQGKWGSGVAVLFRDKFPKSHEEYVIFCEDMVFANGSDVGAVGFTLLTSENIACSVTSFDYGPRKDSPKQILLNTEQALDDLFDQVRSKPGIIRIYSPKINSGLFQVPWSETQAVIERCITKSGLDVQWTVWEL